MFADASEIGLAVIADIGLKGMLISRFLLIGKTRLSPIKITTIPELQVKAALHVSQINVSFRGEHVIWKFNPATAPLFGGFWEWIVKTCKQSIYHVLNWQRLNYEFLATIPFLTEHFLNICPLNPDSNGRQSWKHSRQTISFWVGQVWRFFIFQMRKNIKVTKKCSQWLKLTWRTSRQDGWKIVFQCTKNVNNGLRNVLSEVFTGLEESKCAIFGTMALFDFFDTLTRCGLFIASRQVVSCIQRHWVCSSPEARWRKGLKTSAQKRPKLGDFGES